MHEVQFSHGLSLQTEPMFPKSPKGDGAGAGAGGTGVGGAGAGVGAAGAPNMGPDDAGMGVEP